MSVLVVLLGAAYLLTPAWVFDDEPTSPWLLIAAVALGASIGVSAGIVESRRPHHNRPRAHAARSPGFVVGTAGAALVLARFVDGSAIPWVLLGCVAMAVGLLSYSRLNP